LILNKMNILFAGEGGQGVQVVAEILTKAAIKEGKKATYIPNFGVEQRGGVSLAFVIVDPMRTVYPKFEKADILAIFSDRSVDRSKRYIGSKTIVIKGPAMKNGLKTATPPKAWNIVVLGEVNRKGNVVKKETLVDMMNQRFAKYFAKDPELKKIDHQALEG
jgi:2-oxoglutarate ferredoxin oxidoreductase subunit gamma